MATRSTRLPSAPTAAGQGYHHGDLREALLAAAEALLAERGAEAFTLRECARRAGVSHAAPAHHFGDVRGLLTAVAARGFDHMARLMEAYRSRAPDDALQRLQAVGQAYIDFAIAHRAHFQLMFGSDRLDRADQALQQAGGRCAAPLETAMAEVLRSHGLAPATLPQRLLLAWAAVHGFATLVIEGQCQHLFGFGVEQPDQARAAGAAMLALLQSALAAPASITAPRP